MTINKVGVVGAGQMGNGIAQVLAVAGLDVIICDLSSEALEGAVGTIATSLERFVAKDKISAASRDAAMARLSTSTDLQQLADVDLVIEAVSENEALKLRLLGELDQICQPHTILASNTSSISLTKLAAATQRPDRVVGMHFMNPVPLMKLVELIRALQTSDETHQAIDALCRKIGKVPVTVGDAPGFVANRILLPMINEAVFALYEGLAKPEDIDTVMTLGTNQPMGPLSLADLIGLDTCLSIMEVLYDGFNDSKYRPCPLLRQMVDAGYLGRKSGRGFFQY